MKRAKLPDLHWHDLRHTFASWAVQRRVSLYELKELLGHSTLTMVKRYAHLAPEHLRAAAAALDGVLAPTAVAPPSASDSASAKSTARRQQADGRCRLSTVLSTPHRAVYLGVVVVRFGGEPSGTRTRDPLIKSQVLFRLS